jgi:hypothetical protein
MHLQGAYTQLQRIDLTLDYLALVEAHPTHMRMVKVGLCMHCFRVPYSAAPAPPTSKGGLVSRAQGSCTSISPALPELRSLCGTCR